MATHDHAFAEEFPGLADGLRGQLHVRREIGRGGMGVVFLAHDERLDRFVALKVLPASHAADPDTRERFLREARTAARLAHPNVVPVYRADDVGGTAFFAMAYVEGESLADRLRDRGSLSPVEAVPILRDVAWALAYAHARGVVHRDVKPENILLERATRRTLVTDFGIAHHVELSDEAARLTQTGHVLGTVHYMSPEQVNGETLDGRSDLYALGVVAYQVLSGRLPFQGLPPSAVLVANATRPVQSLADVAPQVPRALAAVVDRCLRKDPDDRYATGEAMAEALERAATSSLGGANASRPDGAAPAARLDETQAAALWRRAARLQADALQRSELHLATLENLEPARPDDGSAAPDVTSTSSRYAMEHVVAAAVEAGISRQYVDLALAELSPGAPARASSDISEREASLFLGADARSLSVTQVVPASPARTLRALGTVLQQQPYDLQLRETLGSHPLDGGVLVFDLPGPIVGVMGASSVGAVNAYWMQVHQGLEARQLHATLRALPGSPARTEIRLTCDVRPGLRGNVRVAQWLAGFCGVSTAFFTGAVMAKTALVMSAAVLGPATAVGLATIGASLYAYRRAYPGMLAKGQREMAGALAAVAAAVQSEDVFGLSGPQASSPGNARSLSPGLEIL